jgi:hypothetical protein
MGGRISASNGPQRPQRGPISDFLLVSFSCVLIFKLEERVSGSCSPVIKLFKFFSTLLALVSQP